MNVKKHTNDEKYGMTILIGTSPQTYRGHDNMHQETTYHEMAAGLTSSSATTKMASPPAATVTANILALTPAPGYMHST